LPAVRQKDASKILLIAGLLADKHEAQRRRNLAEHGLGRVLVEWTSRARGLRGKLF
jgi:hypothetical protein